jgi:hypothetical protein
MKQGFLTSEQYDTLWLLVWKSCFESLLLVMAICFGFVVTAGMTAGMATLLAIIVLFWLSRILLILCNFAQSALTKDPLAESRRKLIFSA